MNENLKALLAAIRYHAETTDSITIEDGIELDQEDLKVLVAYITSLETKVESLESELTEMGEFYDGSHGDI